MIAQGGKLAKISQKTLDSLNAVLPPFWSHGNPIDVLGDARSERYKAAVEACLNDDNIDGILIVFTQQAVSESVEIAKNIVELVRSKILPEQDNFNFVYGLWRSARSQQHP